MKRSIMPEQFKSIAASITVLDVRRKEDYDSSNVIVPGSNWRDPEQIDQWIEAVPRDQQVVIYCVRGGSVSNSVVNRLQSSGINACFIEGGILGLETNGGTLVEKVPA